MGTSVKHRPLPSTSTEMRDRGAELRQRLLMAGVFQYNRWFVDKNPEWEGDASLQYRIQMILNSRGSMTDGPVLIKCEELADKHIGTVKAA